MLDEYLTPERILIRPSAESWRQAVDWAGDVLVSHGDVEPAYIDAIKASISGPGGTYIDLGAGIALAHARPEAGVHRTGLSLLKLDEPVLLADDPDHPIRLFIALAAQDASSHLEVMKELAGLLTDTTRRERLLRAASPADITSVLTKE